MPASPIVKTTPPASPINAAELARIVNIAALQGVHLNPPQVNTTPFTLTPRTPFIAGRGGPRRHKLLHRRPRHRARRSDNR